jgi:hypothetical protein
MNSVYADFILLGLGLLDANLLIGSTERDLIPRVSQDSTIEYVLQRLRLVYFTLLSATILIEIHRQINEIEI